MQYLIDKKLWNILLIISGSETFLTLTYSYKKSTSIKFNICSVASARPSHSFSRIKIYIFVWVCATLRTPITIQGQTFTDTQRDGPIDKPSYGQMDGQSYIYLVFYPERLHSDKHRFDIEFYIACYINRWRGRISIKNVYMGIKWDHFNSA